MRETVIIPLPHLTPCPPSHSPVARLCPCDTVTAQFHSDTVVIPHHYHGDPAPPHSRRFPADYSRQYVRMICHRLQRTRSCKKELRGPLRLGPSIASQLFTRPHTEVFSPPSFSPSFLHSPPHLPSTKAAYVSSLSGPPPWSLLAATETL